MLRLQTIIARFAPAILSLLGMPLFVQQSYGIATIPHPISYMVGTQTIGPKYQFGDQTKLDETAQGILSMGSNVLKFAMGPDYDSFGDAFRTNKKIKSLLDLARDEPSVHQVLDMPFSSYIIWTYCFSSGKLDQNITPDQLAAEYREMYDFTRYLLINYNRTGKTFYLGHWEGDWTLLYWSGFNKINAKETPTPKAIAAMIDWLNTRQKAVDDAKRDTPHTGVEVYHYSEVNLVTTKAMLGGASVTNDVLPHTDVDYVSYSSYDSIHSPDIGTTLTAALNYIAAKLPPKEGISGRRVFLGEYGFPARTCTPQEQDEKSEQVILTCLKWGSPFILYWEFYNNEVDGKGQVGYWLIDDKNVKQPLYYTFEKYDAAARDFVVQFQKANGLPPDDDQFRVFAVGWFSDQLRFATVKNQGR